MKSTFNKTFSKIFAIWLVVFVAFSPSALINQKKVEAIPIPIPGFPVAVMSDVPRWTKDYIDDLIVTILVTTAITTITTSITQWANNGFEGAPTFTQNIEKSLKKTADRETEQFLTDISTADFNGLFFCGPFASEIKNAFRVKLAIQRDATYKSVSKCSIDRILKETGSTLEEFEKDFTKGGWTSWIELTKPQNNRYGAYILAQEELWRRQAKEEDRQRQEWSFGQGFFSIKEKGECLETMTGLTSGPVQPGGAPLGSGGDMIVPDSEGCIRRAPEKSVTPGHVVSTSINKALGLGPDRIVAADEINEMIGAVFQALFMKVLQGARGLYGASNPSEGEESAVDEATRLKDEDVAKISKDIEDAKRGIELQKEIAKIVEKLATCQEQLDELKTRRDQAARDGIDTDGLDSEITAKETECAGLQEQLDKAEEELGKLEEGIVSGENPFKCLFKFEGVAASSPVSYGNAGPVKGSEKGTVLTIPGESGRFYKSVKIDFSMSAGSMPAIIFNFSAGAGNNYYNGMEMAIAEGQGLGRTSFDNNAYAGGPNFFGRNPTTWTPFTDYDVTVTFDSPSNTITALIVEQGDVKGRTVGSFSFSNAMASQDIACTPEGCRLTLMGKSDWTFRNIRVNMTPGGPYNGGVPGRCGLPGGTGGTTDPATPTH